MAAEEIVSKWKLGLAVALAGFALLMWFVFVRPVPSRLAAGIILAKTPRPAGTYVQQPVGNRSGFWTPVRIPIAECHVFEIAVDGFDDHAQLALNDVKSREFEIGQPVTITYTERGLPWLWKRAYVTDMAPRH